VQPRTSSLWWLAGALSIALDVVLLEQALSSEELQDDFRLVGVILGLFLIAGSLILAWCLHRRMVAAIEAMLESTVAAHQDGLVECGVHVRQTPPCSTACQCKLTPPPR
jgi:hypothetical protein